MSTANSPTAPLSPAGQKAYRGLGMEGYLARWYGKITGRNLDDVRRLARSLSAEVPSGGTILEVAPGPGYLAIELAKSGGRTVTGLDISHSFVEMAKQNALQAGVAVDFRHGDASAMPFGDESFDLIVCRAAFKNFSRPLEAINEMHRVLKPGGRALIIDLSKDASLDDIKAQVKQMNLGAINSAITRLTFQHLLLKRAYSQEDFRRLAAESHFGTCEIRAEHIGLEVWLTKQQAKYAD